MPQSKRIIHIFNPDTDYALAAGNNIYNPPAPIVKFQVENALLPVTFASPGDVVIMPHADTDLYKAEHLRDADARSVSIMTLRELMSSYSKDVLETGFEIMPWGWNHTLRHQLSAAGIPDSMLKSNKEIDSLRSLSHRRTAIKFQEILTELLPGFNVPIATEIFSSDEALHFYKSHGDAYFKAPWSSSGRGVVHANELNEEKLSQWIGGFIRRQDSVIAERAFSRIADFASEWTIRNGKVKFIGLSFFNTSPSGRYAGNMLISQDEIEKRISSLSHQWSNIILEAQGKALQYLTEGKYSGPVGIDMLIDDSGIINPCVEINFRQTMGMAAIRQYLNHTSNIL